jgi:hypothetical protein
MRQWEATKGVQAELDHNLVPGCFGKWIPLMECREISEQAAAVVQVRSDLVKGGSAAIQRFQSQILQGLETDKAGEEEE